MNKILLHFISGKTEKTPSANEKYNDAYNLKSYKNYTFELQAKTSAGTGVAAKIIVTTDQASKCFSFIRNRYWLELVWNS